MDNSIKQIIGAALAVCASVGVSQSQTITNGSFEQGFSGWSGTGVADVMPYFSTDGTNSARLNASDSTPNAVLAQTFPTVPGERYALQFDYGSWHASSSSEQRLSVAVSGGATLLSNVVAVVGTTGTMNMIAHRLEFTADATVATLTFRDVSLQTYATDGHLDNVRVELAEPLLTIRVSQVELCWPSRTNQVYQVQFRSTLTTNTWTDLGAAIPGSSPTTCTYDAVAPSSPQRYYRVVLSP
jgi:major type 1 subunit fimbrin (pilin)